MHICASQFSKFPGGACPRTPLEGARAGPRHDRVAITSFGVLEFHAPPPPMTQILDPPLTTNIEQPSFSLLFLFFNSATKEELWSAIHGQRMDPVFLKRLANGTFQARIAPDVVDPNNPTVRRAAVHVFSYLVDGRNMGRNFHGDSC